jgi:hypothetical protein
LTENVYGEITAQLGREQLSLDRVRQASTLAREACGQSHYPLGLFVVGRVLETLESYWRVRGALTADAEIMVSEALMPPLLRYLSARTRARLDGNREAAYLNEVVKSFLQWTADQETVG